MPRKTPPAATPAPEAALAGPASTARYVLRLYVVGVSPHSLRAIANLRRICAEHLQGHYEIETVNLQEHPELAEGARVFVAPTLVKTLPKPMRRIIGDLSRTEDVLLQLDLRPTR